MLSIFVGGVKEAQATYVSNLPMKKAVFFTVLLGLGLAISLLAWRMLAPRPGLVFREVKREKVRVCASERIESFAVKVKPAAQSLMATAFTAVLREDPPFGPTWYEPHPSQVALDPSYAKRLIDTFCWLSTQGETPKEAAPAAEPLGQIELQQRALVNGGAPESILIRIEQILADRKILVSVNKKGQDQEFWVLQDKALQLLRVESAQRQDRRVLRIAPDMTDQLELHSTARKRTVRFTREGSDWEKDAKVDERFGEFINKVVTLQALAIEDPAANPKDCRAARGDLLAKVAGYGNPEEVLVFQGFERGREAMSVCSQTRPGRWRVHADVRVLLRQGLAH